MLIALVVGILHGVDALVRTPWAVGRELEVGPLVLHFRLELLEGAAMATFRALQVPADGQGKAGEGVAEADQIVTDDCGLVQDIEVT